ncbi:hypothetical protein U9M48_042056 [Paspalum notatum var. saurae]|uniref:NB-ARC domain-containing protein n=1 Tax=Paspalum notatum var. saurae TaxID=547442 RepID=A0AAQ3XEV0_PASNO
MSIQSEQTAWASWTHCLRPLHKTVASTIACGSTTQTVEQWEHIHNSLAAQFATNPTMETMMHILDLSYKNLPRHLEACFLHLGIYPEDWLIMRDDAVRQWVAEGFVSNFHGQDVWDLAKSYFNELVNRSIVQPESSDDGDVVACTVHGMMLELITRRSRDDNFIVVLHDPHALAGMQGKVRRLSADLRGTEYGTMAVLSQVRSVTIFGESKWVPTLIEFKFLRVPYIDHIDDVFEIDLTCIGLLSLLRYLKCYLLRFGGCQLETLKLPKLAGCTIIPSDITYLPRLSILVLPWNTRLPDGESKMKSLRTLHGTSLTKSALEDIKGLGELTNLAVLTLHLQSPDKCSSNVDTTVDQDTKIAALCSSLEKLGKLKHFTLYSSVVSYSSDALLSSSSGAPPQSLQWLSLRPWTFSRLPEWMAHLYNLYHLTVAVKQVIQEDIGIIGALPLLRTLDLRISPGIPAERIVVGSTTGFTFLKCFMLCTDRLSCWTFEEGAMPKLERLDLSLDEQEWDEATPSGLEHLSSLEEIDVSTVYYDSDDHDDIIPSENQDSSLEEIDVSTAYYDSDDHDDIIQRTKTGPSGLGLHSRKLLMLFRVSQCLTSRTGDGILQCKQFHNGMR